MRAWPRLLLAVLVALALWSALALWPGLAVGRVQAPGRGVPPPDTSVVAVIPDQQTGRLVQPGAAETISVRVLDASGSPLAGRDVVFVAPEAGASGTFLDSGATVAPAVTDADGLAGATFVAGDVPGAFLVEALVVGADAAATIGITNGAPSTPRVAAADARRAVEQDPALPLPADGSVQLHGPVLLAPGSVVAPAVAGTPAYPGVLLAIDRPTWFFWADDEPLALFEHPVRYILVDATGSTSRLQVLPQGWWPTLRLGGGAPTALLPPGRTNPAAEPLQARQQRAAGLGVRPLERAQDAAEKKCAIVAYGPPDVGLKAAADRFKQFATDTLGIPAADVQSTAGPTTPADVERMIKQAKDSGCTRLYVLVAAHGYQGGVTLASASGGQATFSYDTLGEQLGTLRGAVTDVNVVLVACYSGSAWGFLQGRGISGTVATSADTESRAVIRNWANRGSPFLTDLLAKWAELLAAGGDPPPTLLDASNAMRDAALNPYVILPAPTAGVIYPNGFLFSLPDVAIPKPGDSVTVTIQRPSSSLFPASVSRSELAIADPATAAFGGLGPGEDASRRGLIFEGAQLKPGTESKTVTITGVRPGATEYTVLYRDMNGTFAGRGRITVGAAPEPTRARPTPQATGNRPPEVGPIVAVLQAPFTSYTVQATDPDGDVLGYDWSLSSGEAGCTDFGAVGGRAAWRHDGAGCSHTGPYHPGTITVVVSDGAGGHTVTRTYPGGSASGTGPR